MTVLRVYLRAEEAYLDAAYLGGLGVETTVVDERGYGGNLLAAATSAIRLEVDDDQAEEARQLLHEQIKEAVTLSAPSATPAGESLRTIFRGILVFDILWYMMALSNSHELSAYPSDEAEAYFLTLSVSTRLDKLFELAYWPVLLVSLLASALCFFYVRWGRNLYTVTMLWSLVSTLTPPTSYYWPAAAFAATLQYTLSVIALALMYWSPLSEKFDAPPRSE
ncbi:MAG: hypothetical protein ACKV19_03990 [Verrucomicrobiales bacterium]